jgi:hypothetical protein
MPESRVIFENQHYTACAMKDGSLIVQKRKTGKGCRLIGENAAIWTESIETAIDSKEASFLCRALCTQQPITIKGE